MAVDPICAMEVKEEPKLSYAFRGRNYHFCSEDCLRTFKNDPEGYAKISEPTTSTFKDKKL